MDRGRPPADALNLDTPEPPAAPILAPSGGPSWSAPALVDAWPDARPFPLAGWFERNRFEPVSTAILAVIGAFVAFQLVANLGVLATVLADLLGSGATEPPTAEAVMAAIGEHAHAVLVWNSVGQALGFGLVTWGLARLHTADPAAFLRARPVESSGAGAAGLGLAVLGWLAVYPVVLVAGKLNSLVPLPEWMRLADEARAQMIEGFLLGGQLSTVFLVITVALVPAVFEELLFRGYLMRQVERRLAPAWTFAAVGLTFGAYHLSAAQLLPLSLLGAYLCFVVWATGSVWTGVLVHLLNNGLAVLATAALRGRPDVDPATVGDVDGPWYVSAALAAAGTLAVVAVGRALVARRGALTGGRPDAAPVPSPSSPAPLAVPS